MEKFKSDLLLIKTFLCSFGLEYGVDIASLKNFSKINLLKYGKNSSQILKATVLKIAHHRF